MLSIRAGAQIARYAWASCACFAFYGVAEGRENSAVGVGDGGDAGVSVGIFGGDDVGVGVRAAESLAMGMGATSTLTTGTGVGVTGESILTSSKRCS